VSTGPVDLMSKNKSKHKQNPARPAARATPPVAVAPPPPPPPPPVAPAREIATHSAALRSEASPAALAASVTAPPAEDQDLSAAAIELGEARVLLAARTRELDLARGQLDARERELAQKRSSIDADTKRALEGREALDASARVQAEERQ